MLVWLGEEEKLYKLLLCKLNNNLCRVGLEHFWLLVRS